MKIIVCMKQVPATATASVDPLTKTIVRTGQNAVTNPFDLYALQAALNIRKKIGAEVIGLTMGIPAAQKILRDAIARGADGGAILSDRAFAGADTLATSYALSLGISKLGGADLVICGKMAIDGDTAQIGPELAERLGIAHVSDVTEILEVGEKHLVVRRKWDTIEQELSLPLPALITVDKGENLPDMPTIPGMIRGRNAEIPLFDAESLQADKSRSGLAGSPTQVVKTFTPPMRGQAEEICGTTEEKVKRLAQICKEVLYGAN